MGTFGRRHCRFPNINNCRTQIKIIVSKHPVRRLISAVSESEQKGRTFRGLIPLCGVHPPSALPIFRISIGHCFRPIPWASFFLPHRGLCPTIDAFISWLSSFISHHQSVTAAGESAVLPAVIRIHFPKSDYRGVNKGVYVLLGRTQSGPGRTVKQEQEEISRNHIQTFIYLSVQTNPLNGSSVLSNKN